MSAATPRSHDVDHRQDETGGLAGPRLRNADQVLHHQDCRDRLGLDWSRLSIARIVYGFEQFGRKAEIGESHAYGNVRISVAKNRHT